MAEPISLSEAKRQRRAGNAGADGEGGASPPPEDDLEGCPITALGHIDGKFWFLNSVGERRCLSARQMGSRTELAALFLGDTGWLIDRFPSRDQDGNVTGFRIAKAAEFLMALCGRQGLYGDHIVVRRAGVWRGEGGEPIAHCGDALFVAGERMAPGARIAGQIFAAAAREIYPADRAASVEAGRGIQADIAELWRFRDDGGPIVALGLVGAGYLAAALSWRPNGFICGSSNSGKSYLLNLLRAMTPLSHYSTDTSKAGLESAVNGRAVPTFIDESSDRADQNGAQVLLDVVLSASSGEGTKLHRSTAEGSVRTVEMVGSVIMASIAPPAMQAQHRSRFAMLELVKPAAGVDHNAEMKAAIGRAKRQAPALFARVLGSMPLYDQALEQFRAALGRADCLPREMDQLGSILAGWWILVEDEPPTADHADGAVSAIAAFIRGAEDMAQDDGQWQVLAILLSRVVQLNRSTDQESLAKLIALAMSTDVDGTEARHGALRVLERWGIRPIRRIDDLDRSKRPIPRLGDGNGLWIDQRVEPLRNIFTGTPFAGDRWLTELLRLPSARRSRQNVRVGDMPPGKCIWISWDEINAGAD